MLVNVMCLFALRVRCPLYKEPAMRIVLFFFLLVVTRVVFADNDLRIAVIEPLTGPSAAVGKWWSDHAHMAVDHLNAAGGVLGGRHVSIVTFDSKSSVQEALVILKSIEDQGIRFVFGTAGSNIGIALSDGIAKHNARTPESALLFLNYGSLASELTNELCNFWHFRFGPSSDMQVQGMVYYLAQQKSTNKVYLLHQDYSYGQAVQRLMRQLITLQRPDVRVVGDELIPLQKTKDFAPYVAKMRASGADAVLTSIWGPDLNLLVKASHDFGLTARFYTLNAHFIGAPSAIGKAGVGRLVNIATWHANLAENALEQYALEFKRQYKQDWNYLPAKAAVEMWAKAIDAVGSLDAPKVAKALEGMHHDAGSGALWMRPDDHQISLPLFVSSFTKVGPGVKHSAEDTGFGFRTEFRLEPEAITIAPRCNMERP